MKLKITLFCFTFFSVSICFCQETEKQKDTSSTISASKLDEIIARINKSNFTDKEKVGTISLTASQNIVTYITPPLLPTQKVRAFKKKPFSSPIASAKIVEVDQVVIQIKDGYIVDMHVFTKNSDDDFTNALAPIVFSSDRFSQVEYLTNVRNRTESIVLKDVLKFIPNNSYLPDDGTIWLNVTHPSEVLFRNSGVNSIIDARLYTDVLSVVGNEPNGVVQTEVKYKQFIRNLQMINGGAVFLRYFKTNVHFSKLDSKNNSVLQSAFSRSELLQKNYLTGEGGFNIVSWWVEKKSLSTIYLDYGVGVNVSHFVGSSKTANILCPYMYSEIGLDLKGGSNVSVNIYVKSILQISPETDFDDQSRGMFFHKIGGDFSYFPLNDPASRIFARMNYVVGTIKEEQKHHFFQIQVGYSILVNKLFNK